MPPGEIALTLRDDGGHGRASVVEDNGNGLPQQGRERLTEPYVTTRPRAPASASPSSRRSWKITAASSLLDDRERWRRARQSGVPGRREPIASADRMRQPHDAVRSESRTVQPMAHDILIVDDEADIRMLIAGILEDEGYDDARGRRQRRGARRDPRAPAVAW